MNTFKKICSAIELLLIVGAFLGCFIPQIPNSLFSILGLFYIVAIPIWSITENHKIVPILGGLLSGFVLFFLAIAINFQVHHYPYAKEMIISGSFFSPPLMVVVGIIVLIAKEKAGYLWVNSNFRWLMTGVTFLYVAHQPLLTFWKTVLLTK
jgi:hypothetical protein